MNSGKDYNYKRGAWIMKHPPPSLKHHDSRGAFTMFHPPPIKKIIRTGKIRNFNVDSLQRSVSQIVGSQIVEWTQMYVRLFRINIPPPK